MKLQDYVQNKPILKTDKLLLRPLQYDDVADLKEWLGDNSLYQYWGSVMEKATYKEFSLGDCP